MVTSEYRLCKSILPKVTDVNLLGSFTAYTISFGMFWMIIPHVAIVSNLLLAGNNPSIWEAVTSTNEKLKIQTSETKILESGELAPTKHSASVLRWGLGHNLEAGRLQKVRQLRNRVLRPIFKSGYKTAWLWNRGSSKALWLASYVEEYPDMHTIQSEVLHMSSSSWTFSIFAPAFFLLTIPSFLAGMVW